ncbi:MULTISPECIES: DUF938 domain-containing protein [unclassified Rhizobium]|uniref:DUF938 domain-containing protein n=1 Tax=unclassified Rhizobium TaxID=2613769 RepID=UPI002478123A|nr:MULTISPECIES: DUF938 domain-containing protein [unclassified Rhizobium]
MRDGTHNAPSNAAFDAALKERNPSWGVRDIADLEQVGEAAGSRKPKCRKIGGTDNRGLKLKATAAFDPMSLAAGFELLLAYEYVPTRHSGLGCSKAQNAEPGWRLLKAVR